MKNLARSDMATHTAAPSARQPTLTEKALSLRTTLVVFIIFYFIATPIAQHLMPGEWWYNVTKMEISNVEQGGDPDVVLRRQLLIDAPTRGIWTVRVSNQRGTTVCGNSKTHLYSPKSKLPESGVVKLFRWWMEAQKGDPRNVCSVWPLPVGKYCVYTQHEFFPRGYPSSKIVDSPTSCFYVYPVPSEVPTYIG